MNISGATNDFAKRYLLPEVEGIDQTDPDLFNIPSLRFKTDGGIYVTPTMPLRIQVGDHASGGAAVERQFGAQHRIGNKQNARKGRQYVINVGEGSDAEVESAVRDMLYSAAMADKFYLDAVNVKNEPTKISLYSASLKRRVVLHRGTDADGKKFWSIATVYASDEASVRAKSMGVGVRIGGAAPDATGPQLTSGVARTIAMKLRQRGQFLPTPKTVTLNERGLIVLRHDRPVNEQSCPTRYE